jgi:hypothetical protein
MNSPNQIEPFDTKINFFMVEIGTNNIFLSLLPEYNNLSLSSLEPRLKNNKNKFLYQNWTEKILKGRICIIFKEWGLN